MGHIKQSIPVLIVDDYIIMLKIMSNLLMQLGFEDITQETNVFSALDKLRTQQFQLVIAHWDMEMISGLNFLTEIRADKKLAQIPLVMITDTSKSECAKIVKEACYASYIVKPFNILTLKSRIEMVVGSF